MKPESRIDKTHSSVKIAVRTQNETNRIKKELMIAGKMSKIFEFIAIKSTDQCIKCQKFDHISIHCKQQFFNCKLCGKNHETRHHTCNICQTNESCPHEPPKCVNCQKSHAANNKSCEIFKALLTKTRNNQKDEL